MDKRIVNIALTSTILNFIEAYPEENSLQEVAERIVEQLQTFEDLQRRDKTKHTVLTVSYILIDKLMAELREDQQISCYKGCAHCCRMNVDVTPMEVELIIDFCKQNNIVINQAYLLLQSTIPKTELAFTPALATCTFLSKDNLCTIYPVRPMSCRKWMVTTPSELCNIPKYPTAQIGAWIDLNAEIVAAAINTLQGVESDSLPKILLQQLKKEILKG
ncbi:MAG TPA: YkgJ family cysteine cluster protein [Puia sp.]|jgi:Fe-S-cluster containining protein